MDDHSREHLEESPGVVTVPLVLLAIPSVVVGWICIEPMLFGGLFGDTLFVLPEHDVLARLGETFHGEMGFITHAVQGLPLWFALSGVVTAWFFYLVRPDLPALCAQRLRVIHIALDRKYGFDAFYEQGLAALGRGTGSLFWRVGDRVLIDGLLVNGSARLIGWFSGVLRNVQTGFLYTYAFAMIIGMAILMMLFVFFRLQIHQ